MSDQWYYSKNNQQQGPVSPSNSSSWPTRASCSPMTWYGKTEWANGLRPGRSSGFSRSRQRRLRRFRRPVPSSASVPVSGLPSGAVSVGYPSHVTEGVTFAPPIPQSPGPPGPVNGSTLGFLDALQEAPVNSGPQWYYNLNGNRVGPVDDTAITRLLDAGMLNNDTFVWRAGLDGWIPISQTMLRKRPALWYVNDAAWVGVLVIGWLFTCVTAFVLSRNWKELGNKAGARRCMIWFFSIPAGVLLFIVLMIAGPEVTFEPGLALGLLINFGIAISGYVALYFLEVKPQVMFVRKQLHDRYIHKSWWPPVGIAAAILLLILFLPHVSSKLPISIYNDPNVTFVKTGHLPAHPSITIGEATDAFMGNPRWESGTAPDGTEFVNVRGEIRYMDKPVEAALQFEVNRRLGTFEVRALEFNGVPQNRFVQIGFLEKMYESCH